MDNTCIYLRKSRADEELEAKGEGETLTRHKRILMEFARTHKINVTEIKKEIKSGDSIAARPEMMQLLMEIRKQMYSAILVVDVQRLCRGDAADQGMIIKILKESGTLVITPRKTYDLTNEADEREIEYQMFFGRIEYKYIKKRLNSGRVESAVEGNYQSPIPPYGYDIEYKGRERYLIINKQEAEAVKKMFDMYADGIGATNISKRLSECGYKSKTGITIKESSIINIIKNPIYAGYITWNKRKCSRPDGIHKKCMTYDRDQWMITKGKHDAIVDEALYNKCLGVLEEKNYAYYRTKEANPLAGLIICEQCKAKMVIRNDRHKNKRLCCLTNCGNTSNKFSEVEQRIIEELELYYGKMSEEIHEGESLFNSVSIRNVASMRAQIESLNYTIDTLEGQKNELYDDYESEKCDTDYFKTKMASIRAMIIEATQYRDEIEENIQEYRETQTNDDVTIFRTLLDGYKISDDITEKKEIMYQLLYKVEYKKEKKKGEFEIKIYPKMNKYTGTIIEKAANEFAAGKAAFDIETEIIKEQG